MYRNTGNGGLCEIRPRGRDYVFLNENGDSAVFAWSGPGRLEMVRGGWERGIVASVRPGRGGRIVIRFDSPRSAPGMWMSAD